MADENVDDLDVKDDDTTFFEDPESDTTFIEVQEENERNEEVLMEIAEAVEKHGAQPALLHLVNTDNNLGEFLDMDLSNIRDPVATGKEMSAKIWEKIGDRAGVNIVASGASTEAFHGMITPREFKIVGIQLLLSAFFPFVGLIFGIYMAWKYRIQGVVETLHETYKRVGSLGEDEFKAGKGYIPDRSEFMPYIDGVKETLQLLGEVSNPDKLYALDVSRLSRALHKMGIVLETNTGWLQLWQIKLHSSWDWGTRSLTVGRGGWTKSNFDSMMSQSFSLVQEWNKTFMAWKVAKDKYRAEKKVNKESYKSGEMTRDKYKAAKKDLKIRLKVTKRVTVFVCWRLFGLYQALIYQCQKLG